MGFLIKKERSTRSLTDILGHRRSSRRYGPSFQGGRHQDGITSIQMDSRFRAEIQLNGRALAQAQRKAACPIFFGEIDQALDGPRCPRWGPPWASAPHCHNADPAPPIHRRAYRPTGQNIRAFPGRNRFRNQTSRRHGAFWSRISASWRRVDETAPPQTMVSGHPRVWSRWFWRDVRSTVKTPRPFSPRFVEILSFFLPGHLKTGAHFPSSSGGPQPRRPKIFGQKGAPRECELIER